MFVTSLLRPRPSMCLPGVARSRMVAIGRANHAVSIFSLKRVCGSRLISRSCTRHQPMEQTLPATPDTYLALRASPFELHTLPVTSFEALIYDAGRSGLSGLLGRIISDVLEHRAADAETGRQDQLLLALLNMASTFQKQVPIAPDIIVQLASQYVQNAGVKHMPAHLAAHIMRCTLGLPERTTEQHELVLSLFKHLANTAEYPLLEEGLHVIECVMRDDTVCLTTVMGLVSQTAHVDGERLGEHTLEQARADGFAWRRWVREASGWVGVNDLLHDKADLQTHALRISIWSLCCRAWIRLNRSSRFRDSLCHLRATFSCATEAVTAGAVSQAPPSMLVLKGLLQAHLMQLAGMHTANAIKTALVSIRHVPPEEVSQLTPWVIQTLCERAIQLDETRTAAFILQHYVSCANRVFGNTQLLTQFLRGLPDQLMLAILEYLAHTAAMTEAAEWAKLIVGRIDDLHMDARPEPLRIRWLVCLCSLQLSDQARWLYMRWTGSSGEPLDNDIRATCQNQHTCQASMRHGHFLARVYEVLGPVDSYLSKNSEIPPPLDSSVPGSPPCILVLVRHFANGVDASFARAVRDDFLKVVYSGRSSLPEHYHLTALMQASFMLGDTQVSLRALRTLQSCQYKLDSKDVSVLLRGVTDLAPALGLSLLAEVPRQMRQNPHLYAVVMARCIRAHKFDLADRVYDMACDLNIGPQLVASAPTVLLSCSRDRPPSFVHRTLMMLRDGWQPEYHFLNWIIRTAARGMTPRDARSSSVRFRVSRDQDVAAAVNLFCHVANKREYVDPPTARLVLFQIVLLARRHARRGSLSLASKWRSRWISHVDSVMKALFASPMCFDSSNPPDIQNESMLNYYPENTLPLPMSVVKQAILAYMSLHDQRGVQDLFTWIRKHGILPTDILAKNEHANFNALLQIPYPENHDTST